MEQPVSYEYLAGAYDREDGAQFPDYARPRAGASISAGTYDQATGSSVPAFDHPQHQAQLVAAHGHGTLPPLVPPHRHYASASLDPLDDYGGAGSAEPVSAVSASSMAFEGAMQTASSPSNSGSHPSPQEPSPPPERTKKRKKTKDSIPLAADQPLTSQGTARQRVYLACVQCRSRKIRCDGHKPICEHCVKRGISECTYDSAPRRRGPDRTPGGRQRLQGEESQEPRPRRRRKRETGAPYPEPSARTEDVKPPAPLPKIEPTVPSLQSRIPPGLNGGTGEASTSTPRPQQQPSSSQSVYYSPTDTYAPQAALVHAYNMPGSNPYAPSAYITEEDAQYDNTNEELYQLVSEPSMEFTRKTWWDDLLGLYFAPDVLPHLLPPLSSAQREAAAHGIISDLRHLCRTSNYWLSFIHVPTFFGNLFDPVRRGQMQPSLIVAALALAVFNQSSEVGRGEQGRQMALRLRDEAQRLIEASVNARWISEELAMAAWFVAMFEGSGHPYHSTSRARNAMITLDSIIRVLALTELDREDPYVTTYTTRTGIPIPSGRYALQDSPGSMPAYDASAQRQLRAVEDSARVLPSLRLAPISPAGPAAPGALAPPAQPAAHAHAQEPCACLQLSLGASSPIAHEQTPFWLATARWSDDWSEAEVRKERCRRLCWSSLALAAGHTSVSSGNATRELELSITNPANFALFFNGEAASRTHAYGAGPVRAKETVWALYNRLMLLWHACLRMRGDTSLAYADKAQFAVGAWFELDVIENALNGHTCDLEKSFIYQGREIMFNARMVISYEYQKFIPDATTSFNGFFHRGKAEHWLHRQAAIAKGIMQGMSNVTGLRNNRLAERPSFVFWFMAQASRALMLWRVDNTLMLALDVAEAWLPPIDYLSSLWPCQEQRTRYDTLRRQIAEACVVAGRPLPRPSVLNEGYATVPQALI